MSFGKAGTHYFTCIYNPLARLEGLFTWKGEKVILFLSMYHSDMHIVRSVGGRKVKGITGCFVCCN